MYVCCLCYLLYLSEHLVILHVYSPANGVAGEWKIKDEDTNVKGHLDIPEFSFGEIDDLQVLKIYPVFSISSCLDKSIICDSMIALNYCRLK